ncbi:MAG: DNA polymerase III subunit chi [Alphaproteobacteria bacterium]|nr:DNA polymerase III subunit chi [Alphaproteobacteria bacterium]
MSRVDFYHLQNKRLEDVLPKLLEKVYAINKRAIVRIGNSERIEFLNSLLWTYDEQSFLPHGSKKDGAAEMQPIWLTSENDNPNGADFLFLTDGAEADIEEVQQYERVLNIFDGNSTESVEKARIFWKELKQQSVDIFYWQQNQTGTWEQKG